MIVLTFFATGVAGAQSTAKPVAQSISGCVGRIPNTADKYVIAAGDRCMLLSGSYSPAAVADHEITVTGSVVEASGMAPLTLNVQAVKSTKAACTRTCVLEPPGTRGIHGKERPGAEGGTAGLHGKPESQQQN